MWAKSIDHEDQPPKLNQFYQINLSFFFFFFFFSEGPLAYHISVRIIVTSYERVPVPANDSCTPNSETLPPHQLGVMQAISVRRACVGAVVIVGSLGSPRGNGVPRPPSVAAAPEEVLAIVAAGVNEGAVSLPLVGPPGGVAREGLAPLEGREAELRPHGVVRRQVLLDYVVGSG